MCASGVKKKEEEEEEEEEEEPGKKYKASLESILMSYSF